MQLLKYVLVHKDGVIADFEFGIPATTTLLVPNGVCFRLTNSGIVQRVITYNNVEIAINYITSKISAHGNPIDVNFVTPEVVESGRFVHVILNIPVGTATSTENLNVQCKCF